MYDFIIITHLPSFYKVNLYNEMSNRYKIAVIFLGEGSEIRNNDFKSDSYSFDCFSLSENKFEARNKIFTCLKLIKLLYSLSFHKLIIGGWEMPEFFLASLFAKKKNLSFVMESSIYEYKKNIFKDLLKKLFVKRFSSCHVSGKPQEDLVAKLGFSGCFYTTFGVGLVNEIDNKFIEKLSPAKFKPRKITKLLYVGRLSKEKNLEFIISALSQMKDFHFNIIGSGPDEEYLKSISSSNITFIGYVNNNELKKYYMDNDLFILPSNSEPWGLVVEEAIYYYCPVLVSDSVGCNIDLVLKKSTGLVFETNSTNSFIDRLTEIADYDNYQKYLNNCGPSVFQHLRLKQLSSYDDFYNSQSY